MSVLSKKVLAMRYVAKALNALEFGSPLPPLDEGLSWGQIYEIARMHSLAGTVWYVLDGKVKESADRQLCEKWEKIRTLDFAKNLVQTAEFKRITELLSSGGFKFLPMKGFLLKQLWTKPEYRTMADMDFCVEEKDLPRISELLVSEGYSPSTDGDELVHETFDKPPYLHIEMHKRLQDESEESFDDWQPKESCPNWYVMSDVDFMVFNISHMYKHYNSGGCGARSLFDIYLYTKRRYDSFDVRSFESKLKEKGLYEFYIKIMHLAYFWFSDARELPVETDSMYLTDSLQPTEALLEFEYFITTGGAYGNLDNQVAYAVERRGKLGFIFGKLFLPYRLMCVTFPWLKKLPFLLPFAYVLRWFKVIFNGRFRTVAKAFRKASGKKNG